MAALIAGVHYELSPESNYKNNKELVFVKLTASALKAIEEFLSEQKRDGSAKLKIQFLPGNEGQISIPAIARSNDHGLSCEATFHFSINSNAEMEGARASFECVSSRGARRLESCGPLSRRMFVHANDDTYVDTRNRMASTIAAEQRKHISVIKADQTDIGHRVDVRTVHPYSVSRTTQARRTERPDPPEWCKRAKRLQEPERMEKPKRMERPIPPTACPQLPPATPSHQQYAQHQQHPLNPQRLPTKLGLTRRHLSTRLAYPPAGVISKARGATTATSVSVPDEPPKKKLRISHYHRPSSPSSGYATTFSSERQVENLQLSPVNLKVVDVDIVKNMALRKVFGRRRNIN